MGGIVKGVTSFVGHALEAGPELEAFSQNYNAERKQGLAAERDAADSEARGSLLAGLARQKGTKLLAEQKVAYTASGVDAGVGTAADVGSETTALSELDSMTIRNNAMREALGHRTVAANSKEKQAQLLRQQNAADTGRVLTLTGDAADILAGAAKAGA